MNDKQDHTIRLQQAVAAHQQGDLARAVAEYNAVLAECPHNADALHLVGLIYLQTSRHEEAVDSIRSACRLRPEVALFQTNLGAALYARGDFAGAIEVLREAVRLQPDASDACYNLAVALADSGQQAEAIDTYRDLLSRRPDHVESLENLATLLRQEGDPDGAIETYWKAIEIDAGRPGLWNNLGVAYRECDRQSDALACYNRAIELAGTSEQDLAEALCNRSVIRLQSGDFSGGWSDYEARFRRRRPIQQSSVAPIWNGDDLTEKRILVRAEQGIGDEIMFATCLPELAAAAGECLLECDPRLAPPFSRSLTDVRVISGTVEERRDIDRESLDYQISAGSLPRFLRRHREEFPRRRQFLWADPRKCERWKRELTELAGNLKVGIAWRGGLVNHVARRKSVPLAEWGPLFAIPGIDWVVLQHADHAEEIRDAEETFGVSFIQYDAADPLLDLDETAALIANLDLVICSAGATVHLAGALGRPTWVMLQQVPDFRWLGEAREMLWYTSVRSFRQESRGDWSGVVGGVATRLQESIPAAASLSAA